MKRNINNGLAVRGYDLVTILENKNPKSGNQAINIELEGAMYLFKSEANKKKFMANPEKYQPEYGGFYSIAMSEGALVDANPKSFIVQDNKLFLFFSKYFMLIDTRRQWKKNPNGFKELADNYWETLKEE